MCGSRRHTASPFMEGPAAAINCYAAIGRQSNKLGRKAKGFLIMSAKPEETPQGTIALAFANAIAAGNFELAYSMLSSSFQAMTSVSQLTEEFNMMIDYAECPPELPPDVGLVGEVLDEWPDKKDEDEGWVYISMTNNYYSEAISVVVAQERGRRVIREVEWGRP